MKSYNVYLANVETHVGVAIMTIKADGYITALAEANRICIANHPGYYVSKVENA